MINMKKLASALRFLACYGSTYDIYGQNRYASRRIVRDNKGTHVYLKNISDFYASTTERLEQSKTLADLLIMQAEHAFSSWFADKDKAFKKMKFTDLDEAAKYFANEFSGYAYDNTKNEVDIFLTFEDLQHASGVMDASQILDVEILTAFNRALKLGIDLQIPTLSSLPAVDLKFKTDAYNLIVSSNGKFYDVTPVNKVAFIQDAYRNKVLSEDGEVVRLADLKDNIILTDATNKKLVVTSSSGVVVGLDLRGYRPFSVNCAKICLRDFSIHALGVYLDYSPTFKRFQALCDENEIFTALQWFNYLYRQDQNSEAFKVQKDVEAEIDALLKDKNLQEKYGDTAQTFLTETLPQLKCFRYYGAAVVKAEAEYNGKETKPFLNQVPNLNGVEGYMPHQADALSHMQDSKLNVLQVGTGGGKSIITITDIATKLKAGKIKKPLVCMPTNLLGQFASEIYAFSKNELNVFVYDRSTAKAYSNAYEDQKGAIEFADKNLPPNTIYLVGYNILKSQKDFSGNIFQTSYLGVEQDNYPIADYLAAQNFDAVYFDEAHKFKNMNGSLSAAVKIILSGATNITCMSGTLMYNEVDDINSILQVCAPEVTRDLSENKPTRVMSEAHIKFVKKENQDWAAFLPQFKDYLIPVQLPEGMISAYAAAEQNILKEILESPEMAPYRAYLAGEVDEVDEDAEAKITAYMNLKFQGLETIINAPDTMGLNFESPKVTELRNLIKAHHAGQTYKGINFSHSIGKKIFVYGYNKNVSAHAYKALSDMKSQICWYNGNKAVISEFLTNPNKTILLADINSIAEGFNFQICDTCVQLQSVFVPGMEKQAVARVFRPKVGDVSRPIVNVITIAADNTVDMVKFARLLYKKAKINEVLYEQDVNYQAVHDGYGMNNLRKISLSLKSIQEFESHNQLEQMGYFKAAAGLNAWQSDILDKSKKRLIKEAAQRLGKDPSQINLATDMLIKTEHVAPITNSKKVWTAKPTGFTTRSKDLTIEQARNALLGAFDGTKKEENALLSDNFEGKKVMTPFGVGTIHRVNKKDSLIIIDKSLLQLNNSECILLSDASDAKLLESTYLQTPTKPVVPVKDIIIKDEEAEIDDAFEDDTSGIDVFPCIMHRQATLYSTQKVDSKFIGFGPMIYSRLKTKKAAQALIKKLTSDKSVELEVEPNEDLTEKELDKFIKKGVNFGVAESALSELNELSVRMIRKAATYMCKPKEFRLLKKWILDTRKKSKDDELHPFTIVVNDEFYVYISLRQDPHAKLLLGKKLVAGMTPFKKEAKFYAAFFKSKESLIKELKDIETNYGLNEAESCYNLASLFKKKDAIK